MSPGFSESTARPMDASRDMVDTSVCCRLRLHRLCPSRWTYSWGDGTPSPVHEVQCICTCHPDSAP